MKISQDRLREQAVHVRFKDEPVLLERIIQDLQRCMLEKLPWLDFAFGRAYRLVEHRPNGGKFVYPAAYTGGGEYTSLLPNDRLGNFCFFDIYDPQTISHKATPGLPQCTFSGALVFWYKLDDIYDAEGDDALLHTEDIKESVIRVLSTPGAITTQGRINLLDIYERFENIYKGYSIERIYNNYMYKGEGVQDIDKQFFMYPYAGLRIEFKIETRETV